jgi:Eukaryotic aspartyl protease
MLTTIGNADASLVFGGFDAFRLGQSAHSFPFSSDLDRPLLARLGSITVLDGLHSDGQISLLPSAIPVLLDSTSPYFELPEATCKEFERAFDLKFEPESGQFRVKPSTRQRLRERNPKVRFKITEEYEGDGSVEVELPYASFDLQSWSTFEDKEAINYFPIKIKTTGQPSVLGRVFFQETCVKHFLSVWREFPLTTLDHKGAG